MAEKVEEQTVVIEAEAVANTKNFTTIPNSNSEFCIYTYKAEFESYNQIMRPGFFNTCVYFLNPGDVIRTFRLDLDKKVTHYLEFIVMEVDKITKNVVVAVTANHNLEKKVLG